MTMMTFAQQIAEIMTVTGQGWRECLESRDIDRPFRRRIA